MIVTCGLDYPEIIALAHAPSPSLIVFRLHDETPENIDRHVPKRVPGPSVGTYLLVVRYRALSDSTGHITIIFDKCNNYADKVEAVADSPVHFIGSFVPTRHPDLSAVDLLRAEPRTALQRILAILGNPWETGARCMTLRRNVEPMKTASLTGASI